MLYVKTSTKTTGTKTPNQNQPNPAAATLQLPRVIGGKMLLTIVIGYTLGSGIYALTGGIAGLVGGMAWLPFIIAISIAFLTAASYAELGTKFPKAGGSAWFAQLAFRSLAVTFCVSVAAAGTAIAIAATASLAFTGNLEVLLGQEATSTGTSYSRWLGIGFLLALAAISLVGIRESIAVNVIFTCIEVAGLLLVIGAGTVALLSGSGDPTRLTELSPAPGITAFSAVTMATTMAFFAMTGFEGAVNLSEEAIDPQRDLPKAMFLGVGLAGLLYVLISLVAVSMVAPATLSKGRAPLVQVIEAAGTALPAWLFAAIAIIAVANNALLGITVASRLVYGMAQEGVFPAVFSRLLPSRRTPWAAISLVAAVAIAASSLQNISAVSGATSLLALLIFALVNIAVLRLRSTKVAHTHFHAPAITAVAGAILALFLISPIGDTDYTSYLVAGALIGLGIILWGIQLVSITIRNLN